MPSLIPSQPSVQQKPQVEILVEGELSPFEHEALYKTLRKGFLTNHPSYRPIVDEEISTRVNIVFHHQYSKEIFTDVLHEDWRELKELLKQITYRRGKTGADFTIAFVAPVLQVRFRTGVLEQRELSSALDQIGHLTGIVGQMIRSKTMETAIQTIEAAYDKHSDRWFRFEGLTATDARYVFDEAVFQWVRT